MNDFFEEVREELQADRRRAAWKKLAPLVYATAGLLIAGTAGYEFFGARRQQAIEAATQVLEAGISAARDERYDEARAQFDAALASEGQVADLGAHFRAGLEIEAAGDDPAGAERAAAALWSRSGATNPLTRMAAVKAAYLASERIDYFELERRLRPVVDAGGAFAALAHEILAAKAFESGQVEVARSHYAAIEAAESAWPALRSRAAQGLAMIAVTPPPEARAASGPKAATP